MNQRTAVAAGLATALLSGSWTAAAMSNRCATALGLSDPPTWVGDLVASALAAYRDPPVDRTRELAGYLRTTDAWEKAWTRPKEGAFEPPRIVHLEPTPTRTGRAPWLVTPLPDLSALGNLLSIDQGELAWFADVRGWERTVAEPLRHYRWHIVRRPDSVRLLAAPKPRLKEIQRRLLRHCLAPIPVHDAAHGGVRDHSVRSALDPHAGSDVVIRLDLEAFFASVPAARVWGVLRAAGYPEAVAHTITGLVTTVVPRAVWDEVPVVGDPDRHRRLGNALGRPNLPQGAPTSTALANLVTFSLDRRLSGLATSFGAHYTRYVDDLTFSGGQGLHRARRGFVAAVERIVRDEGWRLNDRKTVVLRSSGRQHALGAVLNERPTLPREQRDALRALLHNCAAHGWRSQVRDRPPEQFRDHVLGLVSWAAGLDPRFGARLRPLADSIDWA